MSHPWVGGTRVTPVGMVHLVYTRGYGTPSIHPWVYSRIASRVYSRVTSPGIHHLPGYTPYVQHPRYRARSRSCARREGPGLKAGERAG